MACLATGLGAVQRHIGGTQERFWTSSAAVAEREAHAGRHHDLTAGDDNAWPQRGRELSRVSIQHGLAAVFDEEAELVAAQPGQERALCDG